MLMPNNAHYAMFSGPDFFGEFIDFKTDTGVPTTSPAAATPNDWVQTTIQAGAGNAAITIDDAAFGVLKIVNDDADDDEVQFQWCAENIIPAAGKEIVLSIRCQLGEATQSDWFMGACVTDTTLIPGHSDSIGLRKDDGDTSVDVDIFAGSSDKASTATAVAVMDTNYNIWTIVIMPSKGDATIADYVRIYREGKIQNEFLNVTLPATEMAFSFGYKNGAAGLSAAARTVLVDWVGWAIRR